MFPGGPAYATELDVYLAIESAGSINKIIRERSEFRASCGRKGVKVRHESANSASS